MPILPTRFSLRLVAAVSIGVVAMTSAHCGGGDGGHSDGPSAATAGTNAGSAGGFGASALSPGSGGSAVGGGSGGSASSDTCSIGLAGDAKINELSASDAHKVCDYSSCMFSNNQTPLIKSACITVGAMAPMIGATCDDAYAQCVAEGSSGVTTSQSCDTAGASQCKVTVNQYTSCLKDTVSQLKSTVNTFSCASADAAMTALASSPASCTVVNQNCKSMQTKPGG